MKTLKLISLFLLIAIAGVVNATQICEPYGSTRDFSITDVDSYVVTCAPKSMAGGLGSFPTIRRSPGGFMAWTYCTDGFASKAEFSVVQDWVLMEPEFLTDFAKAQLGPDSRASLQAMVTKWAGMGLSDPIALALWCPHYEEMRANTPPPVAYVVTPYTGATYRATYAISQPLNGVRTATSNGKVRIKSLDGIATTCDCLKGRVIEGYGTKKTTYCSVNNVATTVANCSPK